MLKDWKSGALSFEDARTRAVQWENAGLGYLHGDWPGGGGIDLDDCRDSQTGEMDPRAQQVIDLAQAHTRVSPSGKGAKIFGGTTGGAWLELNFASPLRVTVQRKTPLYFALGGPVLSDLGADVDLDAVLVQVVSLLGEERPERSTKAPEGKVAAGGRHDALVAEVGSLRRRGHDDATTEAMAVAWGRLHLDPVPASLEQDVREIVRSTSRWREDDDFDRNEKGVPFPTQDNIRRALTRLGLSLSHDVFAQRLMAGSAPLDDAVMSRAWLETEARFKFRPPRDYFQTVVEDTARAHPGHPVREYLDARRWDGVMRLDRWLPMYAKAKDNEYVRAVGALVLVAAVRRVRQPGCKFDELLVLESTQGLDKSSALRALCPNETWFSDSLPLGADAKRTIECTAGTWIAEAADLHGKSRRDIDELKAALSRQVDGPVRLAYGRLPVTVPRQFVVIGTTNKDVYLLDSTGNRRFWPVKVGSFDLEALRRDRDQLWAEAAQREASGASIRLPRELWAVAERQQEHRRVVDPWDELLEAARLGDKVFADQVWAILDLPQGQRTQDHNARLGAVMRGLGYERRKARNDRGEVRWAYVRRDAQSVLHDGEEDQ
jgi:hypothetical protein